MIGPGEDDLADDAGSDDAMARTRGNGGSEQDKAGSRIGLVWVTLVVALVFLILLIDFIAQNNRSVPIHFFTASGHASLAVALLVAAVAGGVVVVLVGTARIVQLRLLARRRAKATRRAEAAIPADQPVAAVDPAAPGTVAPGSAPAAGYPQPVDPERQP
jgi:lipopolysaccharide assembly protein A